VERASRSRAFLRVPSTSVWHRFQYPQAAMPGGFGVLALMLKAGGKSRDSSYMARKGHSLATSQGTRSIRLAQVQGPGQRQSGHRHIGEQEVTCGPGPPQHSSSLGFMARALRKGTEDRHGAQVQGGEARPSSSLRSSGIAPRLDNKEWRAHPAPKRSKGGRTFSSIFFAAFNLSSWASSFL